MTENETCLYDSSVEKSRSSPGKPDANKDVENCINNLKDGDENKTCHENEIAKVQESIKKPITDNNIGQLASEEEQIAKLCEEQNELIDPDDDYVSDDDSINIVIDKETIEECNSSYQTFAKLSKNITGRQTTGLGGTAEKKGRFTVEDFENVGKINGTVAYDVDPESFDDKPWRKPGADITDYFNYGFTEITWQAYITRQRRMMQSLGVTGPAPKIQVHSTKTTASSFMPMQQPFPIDMPPREQIPMMGNGSEPLAPPGVAAYPTPLQIPDETKTLISDIDFSVPPPIVQTDSAYVEEIPPPGDFSAEDPFGQAHILNMYAGGGYEPTQESQWMAPPPVIPSTLGDGHYDTSVAEQINHPVSSSGRRSRDNYGSRRSSRDDEIVSDRGYYDSHRSSRRRYSRSRSPRGEGRHYRDRDRRSDSRRRSERRSRSRSPSRSRHSRKSKREKRDRHSDKERHSVPDIKKEVED